MVSNEILHGIKHEVALHQQPEWYDKLGKIMHEPKEMIQGN